MRHVYEQLAEPGGICVSGKVAREVEKKLAFGFEAMGDQQVKNMTEPVPAYRVVLDGSALAVSPAIPLALPNKPSIAVLPFTNMSGDPEQEYFADGLVEDLITSLSKIPACSSSPGIPHSSTRERRWTSARSPRTSASATCWKGASARRPTGCASPGSWSRGPTATHVWADKFEGAVEDMFDLQDRLTESIVGAIEPSLRRAEIERARRKRPDSLDAYDLYLRALPHAYANTPADTDEALRFLKEALRLDPNYAVAHAHAAWCHEQRFFRGGFHPEDRAAALEHARIALSIGTDDPQALSIGAFVQANITHDYESAIGALDRALDMNGNSALAFGFSALVGSISDRYERASEHARKALRLSPFDPLNYHAYLALAFVCLFTGRHEEAVTYSTRRSRRTRLQPAPCHPRGQPCQSRPP